MKDNKTQLAENPDEKPMTDRDDIRHHILLRLYRGEVIEVSDYPDDKEWTVRRVLRKLEEQGWIEREPPNSPRWSPGPLARALFGSNPESGLEPPGETDMEVAGDALDAAAIDDPPDFATSYGEGGTPEDTDFQGS